MGKKNQPVAWVIGVILLTLTTVIRAFADTAAPDQPLRIISTDAGATELILALGAGDHLIAVDITTRLPAGFRSLPSVGYHRNLSAEGLLALTPTLVAGSDHIGPDVVVRALHQAGVTVLQLPTAHTPEQLSANLRTLAEALGMATETQSLLEQLKQKLAYLKQHPLTDLRTAFLLDTEPGKLRLAGSNTAGSALLQLLGSANVAAYDNYRTISAEALLALRPEIILIAAQDPEQDTARLMRTQPMLAHTPAGHERLILGVDGNSLVAGLSLAAIDEAVRLVDLIHASGAGLAGSALPGGSR